MPEEVRIWSITDGDKLTEIPSSSLNLEARIEDWLDRDISILDPELLVIGRQVQTDFGGSIDLLCLDSAGDLVVVELKRDKTPREITAQILDYGSWVEDLSSERITSIAEARLGAGGLEAEFKRRFEAPLPDTLNEAHRLMIVASRIDESSERIVRYLSGSYGVGINAATFQYFKPLNGSEYLARVFLIEPDGGGHAPKRSKRRPNLTYEELAAIAEEVGVGDLYRHAVEGLEPHLQKHTTRSSVSFTSNFDESRKTVISLLPRESSTADGLQFQVYFRRLRVLLGLSEAEAEALLPQRREPWSYSKEPSGDYDGYQGFFANQAEIDRFLDGLKKAQKSPSKSDT